MPHLGYRAALLAGLVAMATGPAHAAPLLIDLARYTHVATWDLPRITAQEASAVTWNWDTDTLFVIGDEGEALVEISKTGNQLSLMQLTGFDDTEGLTYIGGGQFVIVEERLRNAYLLTYAAGTSVARASLPFSNLGTFAGNIGLEGLSWDPRDGTFVTVKEKTPQEVNLNQITFDGSLAVIEPLFTPMLGLLDISDVQVLATVPALDGTDEADNLLILSQESALLLMVDRNGSVLGSLDISSLADSAEGVTIDGEGNIYIVAENDATPLMFVLSPVVVPLPPAFLLFGGALGVLASLRRRHKPVSQ